MIDSPDRSPDTIRMYSPNQVAWGTVGGPVGLIYFLSSNFSALGKSGSSRKTLMYGAAATVALILLSPLLPEKGTSIGFTILYVYTGRYIAETFQMSNTAIATTPGYAFQSNWRVFWLGLACLVASLAVIVGVAMLSEALGLAKAISGA